MSVNWDDYVELHNQVNWEIIGLDSGWFELAFSSKYRVVRILSNICDSSVVEDDRTNVLGGAKSMPSWPKVNSITNRRIFGTCPCEIVNWT